MSIEQQLAGLAGGLPDGISEGVALGTRLADGFDLYPSPVGEVVVTFNVDGVSSVDLATEGYANRFSERHGRRLLRAEPPSAWGRHIPIALEAGTPGKLPVDLSSRTPFQAQILKIAASIPRGEVRPYGWLAKEANRPEAARAVGSTMARNPIPLIIPCHRVVRSDGHIGEYSLGGPGNKWELLTHEGVDPAHLVELAEHHVRVQGNTSTHVYCHPSCHRIRRSKPGNVVDFTSTHAARSSGFRPCQVCRPGG
jgi:O-6-methylguanine DNA methyltransferase